MSPYVRLAYILTFDLHQESTTALSIDAFYSKKYPVLPRPIIIVTKKKKVPAVRQTRGNDEDSGFLGSEITLAK